MKSNRNISYFPTGRFNHTNVAVPCNNPIGTMDIQSVFDYIVGERAKYATEQLRKIIDEKKKKEFKVIGFEYVTPAGTFSYRNSRNLIAESGFIVADVDNLADDGDVQRVRNIFIHDRHVESALVFTSPSALGVKAFLVRNEAWGRTLKEQFQWLTRYFVFEHGIELDQSGSDITRSCFLPHDPTCYINPKYKKEYD